MVLVVMTCDERSKQASDLDTGRHRRRQKTQDGDGDGDGRREHMQNGLKHKEKDRKEVHK